MPMHQLGRNLVYMQNFRLIGAMVSEFRFFKKKKMKKSTTNLMFTCISHPVRYSHPFCMQLLFHMFSTLMSLEDR